MNGLLLDAILLIVLLLCLAMVAVLLRPELTLDEGFQLLERDAPPSVLSRLVFPQQLIRQAGIMPNQIRLLYWPCKLAIALLLPLVLLEFPGPWGHPLVLLVMSLVGFFALDIWLLKRRAQRRIRIQQSLSFFVDLLCAYLTSGSSLSQAFDHAARFGFKPEHPLAREALLVCIELNAGQSLRKALQSMGRRTGVQELRRLAAVLEVGTQVGAPIRKTLEKQSQILLEKQRTMAIELLNRKSMEMLLPLGLVCLPMFFLLVIFPAGAQLYDAITIIKQLL